MTQCMVHVGWWLLGTYTGGWLLGQSATWALWQWNATIGMKRRAKHAMLLAERPNTGEVIHAQTREGQTELLPEFDEWRTRLFSELGRLEREAGDALLRRGRKALIASYSAAALVSGIAFLA